MFPYRAFGGFDSATASTSAATSAARAGIEIMSTQCTHVDLNTLGGRLTEWGSNGAAFGHNPQLGCVGSTNGSGGAASLGTAGLGTSEHAGTQARRHANRPCEREEEKAQLVFGCWTRRWKCSRTLWHRAYSPLEEGEHEYGRVRGCYCRGQVACFWRDDCRRCCFGWIGHCYHWWDILHWGRRTDTVRVQGQPLCSACGSFFVSAFPTVSSDWESY